MIRELEMQEAMAIWGGDDEPFSFGNAIAGCVGPTFGVGPLTASAQACSTPSGQTSSQFTLGYGWGSIQVTLPGPPAQAVPQAVGTTVGCAVANWALGFVGQRLPGCP